jgi:hypothetical protein
LHSSRKTKRAITAGSVMALKEVWFLFSGYITVLAAQIPTCMP